MSDGPDPINELIVNVLLAAAGIVLLMVTIASMSPEGPL